MKKRIAILLMILFIFQLGIPAWAAPVSVKANIVTAPVTFNDVEIRSEYAKYPLLQYKNIVYIPVEQYKEFLGMSYTWNEPSKSYYVKKDWITEEKLILEKQKTKNALSYTVKIIDCPIHVVDYPEPITMQNRQAEYPVLQFRNMLYFPLTWQYAHNVFGWNYQWTAENGLKIDSRNAIRPDLEYYYPGEEVSPRAVAYAFQYTYFPDGYAKYYKNQEDPTFYLEVKLQGIPKADFSTAFREKFYPDLESYTMPAKINQFWSAPYQKIDNPKIDITRKGNIVTVPFVYLKDVEQKTGVQNCIVTVDVTTETILNVQEITMEQALQYK